jgi:hypothetical protein
MNCPQDATPLDLISQENRSIEYDCSLCGGRFIYSPYENVKNSSHMTSWATLPSANNQTGEYLRCPKDNDLLLNIEGKLQCQACHGIWLSGNKNMATSRKYISGVAAEVMVLLLVGIGLFSWQNGAFNSSADTITAATQAPTRAVIMAVWFFTFMLLFTVPMSIYMQMVQAHRPHFRKAITHPIVTWMPIVVIIIMAANIYFLTP